MDGLLYAIKLAELNLSFLQHQLSISFLLKDISKEDIKVKSFRKDIIDLFHETNAKTQNLINYLKNN